MSATIICDGGRPAGRAGEKKSADFGQARAKRRRARTAPARTDALSGGTEVVRHKLLEGCDAQLSAIFGTSHLYQGLLAPDGRLVHANETSLRAIQSTLDAVLGMPFWQTPWFTGTPGMPDVVRDAVAAVAAGGSFQRDIRLILPIGNRSFDFALRPIYDSKGVVAALIPEAIDITERRKTEDVLRQSHKMEAVGQLTGGLAHDFNNLLTTILGSLELLERRLRKGSVVEPQRYINAARSAAERAATLTQRLLKFARRQTPDARPIEIDRLVDGMAELIRRTMGPAITVEVVCAGHLWTVLADPNQLENALLNLCINARDAMPNGGRLRIEMTNIQVDNRGAGERGLARGEFVSLCVSDTGTGMAPEVIEHAFDPFFTTKPIGEGTGLGLSMVCEFTRQADGQVRIESKLEKGTCIQLCLPRHIGTALNIESAAVPANEPSQAEHGETVLVIDDEAAVLMLVGEVLSDLGYTAIQVTSGAAGLKVLQSKRRVDLLVTDVGLPGGMNGREVADAARALRSGLKVLFITGYADSNVIRTGRLKPGMEVMTKPFSMEALTEKISEMISDNLDR